MSTAEREREREGERGREREGEGWRKGDREGKQGCEIFKGEKFSRVRIFQV